MDVFRSLDLRMCWSNSTCGAQFDFHKGSPTYFQKCGPMPSAEHTSPGNFTSCGAECGDADMTITSYVWIYERVGSEPFAGGPGAAPSPPYAKWSEFAPCAEAVCDGSSSHGRNWGGPPSNGTANGLKIELRLLKVLRLCLRIGAPVQVGGVW